jgi:hypothetical protein
MKISSLLHINGPLEENVDQQLNSPNARLLKAAQAFVVAHEFCTPRTWQKQRSQLSALARLKKPRLERYF